MNDHYPPMIPIPNDLEDEAAAKLLEFLYQLTECFESYYAAQLHRYYHCPDERQPDLWPEQDPPF